MSKTLDLVLMHKYYDMIESGKKQEEYREITPYWFIRLLNYDPEACIDGKSIPTYFIENDGFDSIADGIRWDLEMSGALHFKDFTYVRFHRGYTSTTITFEIECMSIGKGREEWGAEKGKEYFVIKMGTKL